MAFRGTLEATTGEGIGGPWVEEARRIELGVHGASAVNHPGGEPPGTCLPWDAARRMQGLEKRETWGVSLPGAPAVPAEVSWKNAHR
jgi:hypothetical protein